VTNQLLIKRKTLSNGIRLIQFSQPQKMTAQLSVVVEYGSKSNNEKSVGLAHFLEHMLAGGSEDRIQLSRTIEQNGGDINFYTDYEYTIGMADVLPEKLNETSEILSKLFFKDGFEEKKFDLEQKVIFNEIAERMDDPGVVMDNMLRKNLYKINPIRHPVLGYQKTVSQLSIDELENAHQTHYIPQNSILVLTGNFSNKNVESVVEEFQQIKKSVPRSILSGTIKEGKPEKISCKTKTGISQTYLGIGYRTVTGKHPDRPSLDLFSTIIGTGASSRLFRELREKRGLTYSIQSSNCYGSDFGYFSIACAIESSRLKETTELILKEIIDLKTKQISENELLKGKNIIIGNLFRAIDDSSTIQECLASMAIMFGDEYALSK